MSQPENPSTEEPSVPSVGAAGGAAAPGPASDTASGERTSAPNEESVGAAGGAAALGPPSGIASGERANMNHYWMWIAIVVAAMAVSIFAFGTGYPSSVAVDSSVFSFFHNSPNIPFLLIFVTSISFLSLAAFSRDFDSAWKKVQLVLESGAFYFFSGLALIMYAKQASDTAEHPSITFILAMLGIAIMLFGTGSHATGALATSGSNLPSLQTATVDPKVDGAISNPTTQNDWTPFKANAVIAGGAAVLAVIFGFGVIYFKDSIPQVFRNNGDYYRVALRPCVAAAAGTCNEEDIDSFLNLPDVSLADYSISATNADGRELYVRRENKSIQVLAFDDDLRSGHSIFLRFNLLNNAIIQTNANIANLLERSFSLNVPIAGNGEAVCAKGTLPTPTCRLARAGNASSNREDNITLVTYTVDFSVDRQSLGPVSIQAMRTDQDSKLKEVTIQLK
ncbi:hypothetical protein [Mesorhizobium sp.]|uniref:hypothetical protein n=1 Tax=Mesorhizobium sp. TaxID=1871066 RepID=UPI000FE48387|nr:hypothetical protein [Mesorhizobium sp.]RWE78122.1 MAG: hypothetical protein EOS42_06245 [Mesorhizobium sp.]TIV32543.1 MAG: hypothetical protein E5V90_02620 [Mesorhizobium sp.]